MHFCTIIEITFLAGCSSKISCGPRKGLEKSIKNGCGFLFEPSAGLNKVDSKMYELLFKFVLGGSFVFFLLNSSYITAWQKNTPKGKN